MAKHRILSIWASLSILLVAFSATGFAKEPVNNPKVVEATLQTDHVLFQPTAEIQSYKIVLIGPEGRYEYTFVGDETAFLGLVAPDGEILPDGFYKYEATATPFNHIDRLAGKVAGASQRGLAHTASTEPTSGVFTIQQGEIILDDNESDSYERELMRISAKGDSGDTSTNGGTTGTGSTSGDSTGGDSTGGGSTGSATNVAVDVDPGTRDQVFLDDIIVDGSACIGFDCVNGESFGFDTLRLKENNLRIKAQDTSSSASFPSNDWQLTFNDSSNGGANKFSVDDIDGGRTPFTIEATAPSNSLYVDDGGRIGFGTATPVVELHIKDGDTPTLRLEQDGSSGFGPQTWDLAGNETNFFIRDASNGSALPFRIRPGASSNSIYVDTDSDVGMGTPSPVADLHITANNATAGLLVGASITDLDLMVTPSGHLGVGANPGLKTLQVTDTTVGFATFNISDGTQGWTTTANGTNYTIGRDGAPAGAITINGSGNVTLGQNSHFVARNDGDLRLTNATTIPVSASAGLINLYAEDVSGTSELKVLDSAGNRTTLSPHNFSLIGVGSEPLAWSYYSEQGDNAINVDMLRMVRLVEEMSGEKLVHLKNEDETLAKKDAEIDSLNERISKLEALVGQLLKEDK